MTFPVVSYRDTVRVHKALLDSLGVKKLHAVAGASGGSIQAMEWAALDDIFPPELSQRAAARFKSHGGSAEVAIIEGDGGHLDGVLNVARQGEAIRAFLAK
jgi:homoserine acetyltransferase